MDGYAAAGQESRLVERARREMGAAQITKASEQPALEAGMDRLSKELAMIQENVARLDAFRGRLINPRPASAGEKAVNAPTPGTVEGRLQHLIYTTHAIGEHLNEIANDLDRAA